MTVFFSFDRPPPPSFLFIIDILPFSIPLCNLSMAATLLPSVTVFSSPYEINLFFFTVLSTSTSKVLLHRLTDLRLQGSSSFLPFSILLQLSLFMAATLLLSLSAHKLFEEMSHIHIRHVDVLGQFLMLVKLPRFKVGQFGRIFSMESQGSE
ncbi:hypothetical protein L2E82_10422 [Cichorium intybus]|uniref:Uncharacterized protein n=1 Tax=Cichorium intybus TaxID=13427 RepID=A0ACB9GB51_CICIN|nr:hypothetical protein L2E82_10422 [Cichorium intybus]